MFLALAMQYRALLAPAERIALDDAVSVAIGRGAVRRATRVGAGWRVEVDDARMSAPHALLWRDDDTWWVRDEGSANGTWVADVRVERTALRDGDRIETGETMFVFREHAGPADAPLAARLEDLGVLVADILWRAGAGRLHLSRDAATALFAHRWPGDVAELERVVRGAVALTDGDTITAAAVARFL